MKKVVFGVIIGFMLSTSTVVLAENVNESILKGSSYTQEKYVLTEAIQFITSRVNEEVDPSYKINLPPIQIPVPIILTPIPYPNIE